MLQLVQHAVALLFLNRETAGELFHFLGGRLQFGLHGVDGVVHMLEGHQLANLLKIEAHDSTSGTSSKEKGLKGSRRGRKLTLTSADGRARTRARAAVISSPE